MHHKHGTYSIKDMLLVFLWMSCVLYFARLSQEQLAVGWLAAKHTGL